MLRIVRKPSGHSHPFGRAVLGCVAGELLLGLILLFVQCLWQISEHEEDYFCKLNQRKHRGSFLHSPSCDQKSEAARLCNLFMAISAYTWFQVMGSVAVLDLGCVCSAKSSSSCVKEDVGLP